jgi:thiamine pyrophosphokinase
MGESEILWRLPMSLAATEQNYSLLILNRPIPFRFDVFARLWKNAKMKICASGGANRLYEFVPEEERKNFVPDAIVGSLETLLPHVEKHYFSEGSDVIRQEVPDASAFTKCIYHLLSLDTGYSPTAPNSTFEQQKLLDTGDMYLVLGGLDGRFDQQMDILNTAYAHPQKRFILVGPESLVIVLRPGVHRIEIDRDILGNHCGLIPLGNPCKVQTFGLRWNLEKRTPLSFGGLISTSNTYEAEKNTTITIEIDNMLSWSASLFGAHKRFIS